MPRGTLLRGVVSPVIAVNRVISVNPVMRNVSFFLLPQNESILNINLTGLLLTNMQSMHRTP